MELLKYVLKGLLAILIISTSLFILHPILQSEMCEGRSISDSVAQDKGFMIPSDDVLDQATDSELLMIYWTYINTHQVLCRNHKRLGILNDGGKQFCADEKYILKRPCLVYSFGSNFEFNFEIDINQLYGCEMHTFDPSKDIKGVVMPYELHFHLQGLSGKDYIDKHNWEMRKLSTIVKELHHEGKIIDLLKIDIEGSEWDAIPEMIESGVLSRVKQIVIEVHYSYFGVSHSGAEQLKILKKLYENGFRIFMFDHNLFSVKTYDQPIGTITDCNEVSLININFS